jgi:PAS domain-containing protein
MHPIVALLNSFADHRDAQVTRAADRDAQLALSRRLTGWMYWEQDAQGRYTRIECETEEQMLLARCLLGRARWECDGIQLGRSIAGAAANPSPDHDWLAHREQVARGKSFSEMVWSVPLDGTRRVFLVESGRPRQNREGEIIGYCGLIRDVGSALAAERATQNLMTALRVATEPTLLIEATEGSPGWRVRWVNAAACAILGRTDSEISATPRLCLGNDTFLTPSRRHWSGARGKDRRRTRRPLWPDPSRSPRVDPSATPAAPGSAVDRLLPRRNRATAKNKL